MFAMARGGNRIAFSGYGKWALTQSALTKSQGIMCYNRKARGKYVKG
jgi:hypothetical protein